MLKFFRKHRAYVQTRNALSRLSDRELRDIGLCYNDITNMARKAGLETK
jgi:uncharacterized protein YjiS (DUF1127 family)